METWIKNILKKILPPPVNAFNKEIERILDAIVGNRRSLEKRLAQMEQESRAQFAALTAEKQRLLELLDASNEEKRKLTETKQLLETIINGLKEQKQRNETIVSELKEQKQQNEITVSELRTEKQLLDKTQKTIDEILWGQIFRDTISSSEWLGNKSFSLGRWAAGYQYMYILYRVLNEMRPKHILELGLGQTTRMIGQYAAFHEECSHYVVEHDKNWIDFFERDFFLGERTEVVNLALKNKTYYDDDTVLAYDNFRETFVNKKFDLISIDGPFGSNSKYSRVDILEILPNCLYSSFVILFDDYNRKGEQNTVAQVKEKLTDSAIPFYFGEYTGKKSSCIIVSENLNFLCSM